MKFNNPDDFYFVQIIKRRKDNPGLSRDMKWINNYFVYNLEYFKEKEADVVEECTKNNARAYIHLNVRNAKKVALYTLKNLTDYIINGDYKAAKKAYTTSCGQHHSDPDKKWIIDIDTPDVEIQTLIFNHVVDLHRQVDPKGEKYLCHGFIPTKHGVHLVTNPFRLDQFKFKDVDIHKDNPTVLFIP